MYIKVNAHPNSRKEKIIKKREDCYEIWLKEPAKQNMANNRIVLIIKEIFPEFKQIRIINGHNSPSKMISAE